MKVLKVAKSVNYFISEMALNNKQELFYTHVFMFHNYYLVILES